MYTLEVWENFGLPIFNLAEHLLELELSGAYSVRLLSWATDFGSGEALKLIGHIGSLLWQATLGVYSLQPPIWIWRST